MRISRGGISRCGQRLYGEDLFRREPGGIAERFVDVFALEVRVRLKDLFRAHPIRNKVEDQGDRHAHATNARPSAHDLGIEGDARKADHSASVYTESESPSTPLIGVGRTGWFPGPPSLRTGHADLPHPALRLVVLPPRGLTGLRIGCGKGEQPLLSKEGIGPAVVIQAPGPSFALVTVAQDATQPHPGPLVQLLKDRPVAVLEVFKPTSLDRDQLRKRPLYHLPPLTPTSRAVNMRSVQTLGSTQDQRPWTSPA